MSSMCECGHEETQHRWSHALDGTLVRTHCVQSEPNESDPPTCECRQFRPKARKLWTVQIFEGSSCPLIMTAKGEEPALGTDGVVYFERCDGAPTYVLSGTVSWTEYFPAEEPKT